jgi:hypothetical protein
MPTKCYQEGVKGAASLETQALVLIPSLQRGLFCYMLCPCDCPWFDNHPQGLSLLARSVHKNHFIFFLAFLGHVFLSVDNKRVAWKPFLMAHPVDVPANLSSFRVFVCSTSSFPVVPSFHRPIPCPIAYNLIHSVENAS